MSLGSQSFDTDPPANPASLSSMSSGTSDGSAMAALAAQSIAGLSSNDVGKTLRLIESLAAARDQPSAIEAIVRQTSIHFPGSSVRCGVGRGQLKRLYDRKLGWLGRESTLFGDAQSQWAAAISNQDYCAAVDDSLVVSIPDNDRDGECIVWISGPRTLEYSRDWLRLCLPTLRVVLWDKPSRWWLRLPERIQLGSSAWLLGAMFVFVVIAVFPIRYRIGCTVVVQPVQQRLVASPFEATLLETMIKPGDAVSAGDTLARLDGRPLRLDYESVQAELQEKSKEQDVALATGRIADAQRAALQVKQLQRRSDLLSDRLSRLDVISPISGVVVSGDLDRFIGSPLTTGQTIFEVAPLERMAVEIEIPEHEIGYVTSGADARIKIAAVANRSMHTTLSHIYPAAEIRGDRNVFVARVIVDNTSGELRPGMQGEATTYGPLRPTSWTWTRGAWEKALWWIGY